MTSPEEIQAAIEDATDVGPSLVLQAKAFLIDHAPGQTNALIDEFTAHMTATVRQPVLVHPSANAAEVIANCARWVACQRAGAEAVWALIGTGALLPKSPSFGARELTLGWTTVVPGSGGTSSGWRFGQAAAVPSEIALPASGATRLTDGDLLLGTLEIADLDATIAESLRSAVACFRSDLYLPAQVMLGRAVEGAWTLLGEALVAAVPDESAAIKVGRDLQRGVHFAQLPERIETLYTHDAYAAIVSASNVKPADLRGAQVWTEALREARNAVHHGTAPPMPATWETTAALLMGVVPNLRLLWRARAAADRFRTGM